MHISLLAATGYSVSTLNEKDSESEKSPEEIRESLNDMVHRLDQVSESSENWRAAVEQNKERWEELKTKIHTRQRALKRLVIDKKAGLIGPEEFDRRYREIQDELTDLEFQVYNLRLGTSAETD
jgi:chromosome segregation ATPase